MPALSFIERFAGLVETRAKRQTIRRVWKRPIKVGDTLYLYTGMRTKRCRKLRTAVCLDVIPIKIFHDHIDFKMKAVNMGLWKKQAELDWLLDQFARRDGFDSWEEMRDWFKNRYGLPFEGVLITW